MALNVGFAERRFSFAYSHLAWTQTQWDKLLNTDSSPFYLEFKYNRQNDGAWVGDVQDPPAHDTNKYSIKTEVYMGLCARGVTKPYFIYSPLRVNGKNYSYQT